MVENKPIRKEKENMANIAMKRGNYCQKTF